MPTARKALPPPSHPTSHGSSRRRYPPYCPELVVVGGPNQGSTVDTFGGMIHVKWDETAAVTPFGQLAFFIEFLKTAGLWDGWVNDCPVTYESPNAPSKADVLGTILLSVLAGH